jgi:hypothetical protein
MEAVLQRLVEEISRNNNAWSGHTLQDHDLDDFAGYPDTEIEVIAALFCEKHETQRDIALGGEEGEEDFRLDDEDHQIINDPQLLPAITTLCLNGLPEDFIGSFGKLQESTEWRCPGTYRAQVALVVQVLHVDPMKISFGMMSPMFGKSKAGIYKKYEKNQVQRQAHGRSSL